MLTEDQTIEILKKTNSLLEGHFILSSGLRSERYLQCAQLMMHADLAERVCESLAEKIKSEKVITLNFFISLGGFKKKGDKIITPPSFLNT